MLKNEIPWPYFTRETLPPIDRIINRITLTTALTREVESIFSPDAKEMGQKELLDRMQERFPYPKNADAPMPVKDTLARKFSIVAVSGLAIAAGTALCGAVMPTVINMIENSLPHY